MWGSYVGILYFVIWGGIIATLLWGSLLALRGQRNWCTLLLALGSGAMMIGVLAIAAMIITMIGFEERFAVLSIAAVIGAIMIVLGIVLFCAGFVGLGARYGAITSRAQELETMVGELGRRLG